MVSGRACGSGTRAPLWPILPSTDTRVVSVVLRVIVLRSTHNWVTHGLVQAQVHPAARAVRSRPFVSAGPFCRGSFALLVGTGRSPRTRRKPHVHCMWKRLAGRPTGDARLPVTVQAQVHPPARAVRSRPFVSAGPFCRGSFALGTGRIPRRKPHVHCMWKRLAGRPTGDARLVQAQVHPPARAVRSRPFVSAGPSKFLPWIVRTRYGPQPAEEKAACALHVEA
jgi:hypothetical protein